MNIARIFGLFFIFSVTGSADAKEIPVEEEINSTVITRAKNSTLDRQARFFQPSMDGECGGIIDGDQMVEKTGEISSPNYPNLYPQGLHCKWVIKAGKGRRVKLHFESFDVTHTDACRDDYLMATSKSSTAAGAPSDWQEAGNSASSEQETYHGRFCGTNVPRDILSNGDVIFLEFVTSPDGETCNGFLARYSFEKVLANCGDEISSLEFEFVNTEFPKEVANRSLDCQLKISHECDIPICQIRLDFKEFTLQPPSLGDCLDDKFIIRANDPVPILCGVNDGQHVYVDVKGRTETEIHVLLNRILPKPVGHDDHLDPFYNHTLEYHYEIKNNRKWRIQVYQIPCDCEYEADSTIPSKAPSGCLQYHSELRGRIRSFNYNGFKQDLDSCFIGTEKECNTTIPTGHLNNLKYNICIKRLEGQCGIKYSADADESFLLSGQAIGNETHLRNIGSGSARCQTNYVVIPNGFTISSPERKTRDRFCGSALGSGAEGPVLSFSSPFYMGVNTEHNLFSPNVDKGNRGFELQYKLIPCSSAHMYR